MTEPSLAQSISETWPDIAEAHVMGIAADKVVLLLLRIEHPWWRPFRLTRDERIRREVQRAILSQAFTEIVYLVEVTSTMEAFEDVLCTLSAAGYEPPEKSA